MNDRQQRLLSAALVVMLTACAGAGVSDDVDTTTVRAFVNARLIDGDGSVIAERGGLLVDGDRIVGVGDVDVPAGAEVLDLTGRTVMPGLINAHGHVADTRGLESGPEHYTTENLTRQLRLYASYGVTTVVSLGGDGPEGFALRDASSGGALDRARLLVAGPVVSAATPEGARAEVDRVAAMRPDFIKIRVDDNLGSTRKMPLDVARAVIDQARTHGLPVAAHVFYLADANLLVEAGVALIAHSVRDQPVDDALIERLRNRNLCVSPTLTREVSTFIYESEPEFFGDPFFLRSADAAVLDELREPARQARMRESTSAQRYKAALDVAEDNARRLAEAGVRLAFGTDTGPPARFQGYFEHMELGLMQDAGIPPATVLASATGHAAGCMGLEDRGHLRHGQVADFIVLTGNPLDDVREVRTIESVWIGGDRVER